MAKKHLSHDQKRKAKLAKRAKKAPQPTNLAYTGNKYKTDDLLPLTQATESAICQAYVMTGRTMTDHTVRGALESLVMQMRGPGLPPYEHEHEVAYEPGKEQELIVWAIRHNWHHLFEEEAHPGTDALVGILRTLLNSLDTFGTPSKQSRGYLNFIEGFLKKGGVTFEGPEKEEEDELLDRGRDWVLDHIGVARDDFMAMADKLIAAGEAERVANVAQRLIGELGGESQQVQKELGELSIRAQKSFPKLAGPAAPAAPPLPPLPEGGEGSR
jgi:hypothetical protein